jgi:hypothetical protein
MAQSGLFATTPEEPGRLELYFLGFEPEEILLVSPLPTVVQEAVDAVVRYGCATSARSWERRHPDFAERALATILGQGLSAELVIPAGPGCTYRWNERPAEE